MPANHASLQQPVLQGQPSPDAEHPNVFVAFQEPVSQEWLDLCLSRYSSRVGKHFQLSEAGFLVQRVPPEQRGSEMANLGEMVTEVNTALRRASE